MNDDQVEHAAYLLREAAQDARRSADYNSTEAGNLQLQVDQKRQAAKRNIELAEAFDAAAKVLLAQE